MLRSQNSSYPRVTESAFEHEATSFSCENPVFQSLHLKNFSKSEDDRLHLVFLHSLYNSSICLGKRTLFHGNSIKVKK